MSIFKMIFESSTAQAIPLFYKAISFTSHHSLIVSKLYQDINSSFTNLSQNKG